MSQTNPYQAPTSDLNQPSATGDHPLNPNWDIGATLSEAWALTSGFKGTFWGAFLLSMGLAVLAGVVAGLLTGGAAAASSGAAIVFLILGQLIQLVITAPLTAGLFMIGIKRATGQPVSAFMVFDYFPKTLPMFLAYLLVIVLVVIGLVLLVIPGIYLAVAYALVLPLIADKNLSIWQALETSRKGLSTCWFRFFGLGILGFVIISISAIPLFIGLIWTLPWLYIALGIVYRDLFGVNVN